MTLHDVALDDKFDLGKERIFLSGAQAVIRMLLMQRERDRRSRAEHRRLRLRLSRLAARRARPAAVEGQEASSREANIVFQPGLNEELAATACWGSQQTELLGEGKHDGVFSVWYGKGPGVDRSGDVFRHANLAGSSRHGGVLALMGDDHMAESSTIAHATEFAVRRHDDPDPQPGRRAGADRLRALRLRACRASPAPGRRSNASRTISNRRRRSMSRSTG